MRFDDILHLDAKSLVWQPGRLSGMCYQTKTTGTTKNRTARPIVVLGVWLSGLDWLSPWREAVDKLGLPTDRDWFLPEPCWPDRVSFLLQPCSHTIAQAWYRNLLVETGVELQRARLLSLHGLRSVLDTWAAEKGVGASDRKFLGCWAVEESADHYVRSTTAIVTRVVNELGNSIQAG